MSAGDTDLEEFIRQQKHKLEVTKQEVAKHSPRGQEAGPPARKQWNKNPPPQDLHFHSTPLHQQKSYDILCFETSPVSTVKHWPHKIPCIDYRNQPKYGSDSPEKSVLKSIDNSPDNAPSKYEQPTRLQFYGNSPVRREQFHGKSPLSETSPDTPMYGKSPQNLNGKLPGKFSQSPYTSLVSPGRDGSFFDSLGKYDEKRKKYVEQRKKDYHSYISSHAVAPQLRREDTPEEGGSLPIGSHEDRQRKLREERRREYNKLLEQNGSKNPPRQPPREPSSEQGLNIGGYDGQRQKLQNQRHSEYQDYQAPQGRRNPLKENIPPKPPTPDEGLLGKMGQYGDKRKQLEAERTKEYNRHKAGYDVRSQGRIGTDDAEEYAATLPGLQDRNSAQERAKQQRKREYNDLLDQRRGRQSRLNVEDLEYPSEPKPAPEERSRSAPFDDTAEEFREFLAYKRAKDQLTRPRPTSIRDNVTPTDRPRDPQYIEDVPPPTRSRPRRRDEDSYATLPGMRDHPSAELDKMKARNNEYNEFLRQQKQTRERSRSRNRFEEEDYRQGPRKGWATPTYEEILDKKRQDERAYRRYDPDPGLGGESYLRNSVSDSHLNTRSRGGRPPPGPPPQTRGRPAGRQREPDSDYGATLLIGNQVTASADQRRKANYRDQLRQQMEENQRNKQRQKDEDLRVNPTGEFDIGKRADRTRLPSPPPPQQQQPQYAPSRSRAGNYDDFSPRDIVYRDPQPKLGGGGGILENGFDGIYGPTKLNSLLPKATSIYSGGVDGYSTSLEDAYRYYGMQDPYDPANRPPPPRPQFQQQSRPSDVPRITFADEREQPPPPRSERRENPKANPGGFPSEDPNDKANKQRAYQEELKRQIEEDRQKKQREKAEKDRYEAKLEAEMRNYNPYGQGGGGAPMRDTDGNIVADLRTMKLDNEDPGKTPRGGYSPTKTSINFLEKEKSQGKTPKADDDHTRGGNGIFGDPMTDNQKKSREKYQEELRKQIEEKKRQEELEKERQRQEDERLLKKIEEDNRRIQEEFEAEKRKEREKKEAAERHAEELRKVKEEDQRKILERRRLEDEKRQEELRRMEEEKRRERDTTKSPPIPTLRPKSGNKPPPSPPVPALRPRQGEEDAAGKPPSRAASASQAQRRRPDSRLAQEHRGSSPPVPALRSKTEPVNIPPVPASPPVPARRPQSRAHSADVLNQLAKMRQQLQSERARVETDLKIEQEEPDVYDPRIFPKEPPESNPYRHLYEESDNEGDLNPKDMGLYRENTTASATMLESESAFIAVPSDEYPLETPGRRNDSARSRRRRQEAQTPYTPARTPNGYNSYGGSMVSLDTENLNKKNEERLRKLKSLAGDDISTGDPEDILERFMSKQKHNRPPSSQTLQDDSWLRPGTNNR